MDARATEANEEGGGYNAQRGSRMARCVLRAFWSMFGTACCNDTWWRRFFLFLSRYSPPRVSRYNFIRDHESLRPLQNRCWPFEFAYHGPHARSLRLCTRTGNPRPARSCCPRSRGSLRLSRPHRPRPRDRSRRAARSFRPRAGQHRSRGHCIHGRRHSRRASTRSCRNPRHRI